MRSTSGEAALPPPQGDFLEICENIRVSVCKEGNPHSPELDKKSLLCYITMMFYIYRIGLKEIKMSGSRDLCIVIPCYNESESIVALLKGLHQLYPEAALAVIDDLSKDNSVELVRELTKEIPQVRLIPLPVNLGIGGAMQAGFKFACRNGFKYAVKCDGDGQHPAEQIKDLLEPLKNGEADVVIGSRFLQKRGFQSTFARRIGIAFFRVLCKVLTGKKITDNTSGFRAYNQKSLSFVADHYPSFDYPEPEEVILLFRNRFRVQELPVEMSSRTGGTSSINLMRSCYYMCKVTFASIIAAIRPREVE